MSKKYKNNYFKIKNTLNNNDKHIFIEIIAMINIRVCMQLQERGG